MTSFPELWTYFEKRAFAMLSSSQHKPVVWQEAFETTEGIPPGTGVEVWKGPSSVEKAITARMDVILAFGL